MNFIWYILIGIIAGYVAGKITRGFGDNRWCVGRLGVFSARTCGNRHHRQFDNFRCGGYPVSVDCFIIQPFPLIFCDAFIILTNIN